MKRPRRSLCRHCRTLGRPLAIVAPTIAGHRKRARGGSCRAPGRSSRSGVSTGSPGCHGRAKCGRRSRGLRRDGDGGRVDGMRFRVVPATGREGMPAKSAIRPASTPSAGSRSFLIGPAATAGRGGSRPRAGLAVGRGRASCYPGRRAPPTWTVPAGPRRPSPCCQARLPLPTSRPSCCRWGRASCPDRACARPRRRWRSPGGGPA